MGRHHKHHHKKNIFKSVGHGVHKAVKGVHKDIKSVGHSVQKDIKGLGTGLGNFGKGLTSSFTTIAIIGGGVLAFILINNMNNSKT